MDGPAEEPRYPNFAGKHALDAFFGPQDFVAYLRRQGRLAGYQPPGGIIFCYEPALLSHVVETEGARGQSSQHDHRGLLRLPSTRGRVGVLGGFGIGGPAAAARLEEFIALGTRRFISVGTAGGLQQSGRVGDAVVCERAIRDEGVSHHYLPPGTYAVASSSLTAALTAELDRMHTPFTAGTAWTIDAPYRETVDEARHYQAAGVICVEMEAAALFAVAAHRQVDVASAFVISDSLSDLIWEPHFLSKTTIDALIGIYGAAVRVLDRCASP